MNSSAGVTLTMTGAVARLTIHQPARRNAMTEAMWEQLDSHLSGLRDSPARALILGGGGAHFCAGADITELRQQLARPEQLRANSERIQVVQQALAALPIPSLAAIRGACVGGGVGLALCCDLRLATGDARFALTPTRLGLHYSLADSRRLAGVIGLARARQMLLTANLVDATEAKRWGLVTELHPDGEALEAAAMDYAQAWAQSSPAAIRQTKRVLAHLDGSQPRQEAELKTEFLAAFDHADFREGASAFLEKRPPQFGDDDE